MQCTDYCQLILYFPDIEVEKIVMAESARSGVASIYSHDYYKYRRHMETVEKDKEEVRLLKTFLFLAVILQLATVHLYSSDGCTEKIFSGDFNCDNTVFQMSNSMHDYVKMVRTECDCDVETTRIPGLAEVNPSSQKSPDQAHGSHPANILDLFTTSYLIQSGFLDCGSKIHSILTSETLGGKCDYFRL